MEIKLQTLNLRNFKGIKSFSLKFTNCETKIYGDNGTGKTTLFDSFIWCLFGKDHLGRSDYQLKMYDNGKTINKQDAEVELVLFVDEKPLTLSRIYKENWVKPKTESEEVFKGNSTVYKINDVSVSAGEYNMKVSTICTEELFKAITNPSYFPNLSKEDQRTLLFRMVGEITDADIAGNNQDFKELINEVSGVSFEAFRKELLSKKRKIKLEIDDIPARIDELKRNIPEKKDWNKIEQEILLKNKEIEEIDAQIADISKQSEQEGKLRFDKQKRINELKLKNQQIEFEISSTKNQRINDLKTQIYEIEKKEANAETDKKQIAFEIESLKKELVEKNALLETLRISWRTINSDQLTFPEGAFICPTCKRTLEVDDIESKQKEMTESFNKRKSEKLKENQTSGISVAAKIKDIECKISDLSQKGIDEVQFSGTLKNGLLAQIEKLSNEPVNYPVEYSSNITEINMLEQELNKPIDISSTDFLKTKRSEVIASIDVLKSALSSKIYIATTNLRINELEKQFKVLNQLLADLEKKEFTLKEFEFSKNEQYEKIINEMFEFTKFKLFHTQVDGQVVPTCEAMIDGVPYSTLNNAMQIFCGLDIIKTISNFNDMYAPIWIDNRESVIRIPEMKSQIINLIVSEGVENLTVK